MFGGVGGQYKTVLAHNSIDTNTVWKKFCFILSDRSNFHVISNLSIAFHVFSKCILTSHSVDVMLLSRYKNWFINLRSMSVAVEMTPFCLKYMYSYLHLRRSQCLQLFALGYAFGILLGRVYLREALCRLCSHSFSWILSASCLF